MSENQSPVVSSSNTKYISIIPENGEVFNPTQKIIYNIEPNLGFIKRDTYLVFDVLNTSTNQAMVAFPQSVGAHAMIQDIRIYSKTTGVLLEALDNYNQLQTILNQYGYDDKTQLRMKEGVGSPTASRLNVVNTANGALAIAGMTTAAYDIANLQLSPLADVAGGLRNTPKYTPRRFCIPLRCGLFRHFDEERLIPVLNMGGLRIEINLADSNLALTRLSCASDGVADGGTGAGPYGHQFLDLMNGGLLCDTRGAGGNTTFNITAITSSEKLGLCIGNSVRMSGGNIGADITRTITGIGDDNAGNVSITLSGANVAATNNAVRCFVSLVGAGGAGTGSGTGIDAMNYQITNTEMRVAVVAPNPQQQKDLMKELTYEFTSYDLFLDNIGQATLRHQVPINSVSSKALGVVSIPYDANNERNESQQSYYNGNTPTDMLINSVQFFINNKLYPLRNYNPNSLNDKVLAINENVKTLKAIGIPPRHLGANEYSMCEDYNNLYFVGRELARNGFVFDLRNAEAELRLGFSAARPAGNRIRVNTYVFSKKVVETSPAGVQVVL